MVTKALRKERSHEAILANAARLVRERGIAGAKVADVMGAAGLTVGGFYAHFASKEDLLDAAIRRTASEMRDSLFGRLDEKPAEDRAEVVLKRYLSAAHRDATDVGCPLPAIAAEVAISAPAHRAVVEEQLLGMTAELAKLLPARAVGREKSRPSPRVVALGLVSLMYGGLALSRAVRGTELSDEILRACRSLGAFAARGGAGHHDPAGATVAAEAASKTSKNRRTS